MSIPTFRLRTLMVVVLLLAADSWACSALWDRSGLRLTCALATLPTANVLILAMPMLMGRWNYWHGFLACGWAAVMLTTSLWAYLGYSFLAPLALIEPLLGSVGGGAKVAAKVAFILVAYAAPQLLAAHLGGWWASRYRVVIEWR